MDEIQKIRLLARAQIEIDDPLAEQELLEAETKAREEQRSHLTNLAKLRDIRHEYVEVLAERLQYLHVRALMSIFAETRMEPETAMELARLFEVDDNVDFPS
jgi:hypothetical protein